VKNEYNYAQPGGGIMENNLTDPQEHLKASPGMHVVIDLVLQDGVERLEFVIVDDKQADFSHGFLGAGTPLAQALLGRAAHTIIPYRVNDSREVRVISVSRSENAPPPDTAARHEEVMRKAIDHSDRINAMIFASSFSGKWGDYDPTGFSEEDEEKP
jgi:hypothetical protein